MTFPRSTRALLDLCQRLPAPATALDIASFQGAVAQQLGCEYVHDHWTACQEARDAGVMTVHHADRLPAGRYHHIFLDARDLDPALAAQFAAEAASLLEPGGRLFTTVRRSDLERWFTEIREEDEVLIAQSPGGSRVAPEPISYSVTVNGNPFTLQSEPGVFSPRGIDPGTEAMLSVIAATPGQRFLDLGCGVGVVSLVASRLWGCEVTAVDVSARALRLTRQNVPEATVVAGDGFSALQDRQFDLIASNPPYHTDFGVAKRFIEGAYQHLAPGGRLYLVVKRADWYIQKVRAVFGGCRVAEQDGYAVLTAEKRREAPGPARPPEPRMTKKHAKRMAASKKRR